MLTREHINAMEAGPEMDRAVADVLFATFVPAAPYGLETTEMIQADLAACATGDYYIRDVAGRELVCMPPKGSGWPWKPSTDWNLAMFAAEKFGLFEIHDCLLDCCETMWGISTKRAWGEFWNDGGELNEVATAPTGPLAICRAILTLHSQQQLVSSTESG